DILREYNNDMYDFSFNIISNLVKYMGANQGGLFVINDDNKDDIFFELAAGYAYDIRKILRKNVKPGVGLVGRCILESESIYISNLPEDYINITSGLGEKSPQYLLIVPFKFNNQIYAVAEIASFTEIEPYKQQFVEEVGNSIASTIATVKINIRTNKLLQELKVQSEELSSQEEEMRQNMEAMKATQEEMTRKVDEWGQTVESLNQLIMLTEYTSAGKITSVNSKVLEFFKKEKMLVLNEVTPLYDTIYESEKTNSDEFWLQIRLGRQKVVSKTVSVDNVHYNIIETYNPVQNYYGKIYKAICLIEVKDEGVLRKEDAGNNNPEGEWF
nr:GAF domain-containing protein [Bacteroidales bacterium]